MLQFRLAWRTTSGRSVESFDPMVLHQSFEQTIRDLKVLNEKMKRKSEKLEAQVWMQQYAITAVVLSSYSLRLRPQKRSKSTLFNISQNSKF